MLYLGIDGGGSKTEAVLCDESGHILQYVRAGASAPSSVPLDQLSQTLAGLYRDLELAQYGPITGYAGISGCATPQDRELFHRASDPLLPSNVQLLVGSDCDCAMNTALGPQGDCMLLIAGTGSVGYLRQNGEKTRIGGWGYLIGDEGSGFDMGRRAICAALKDFDGRGPKTLLRTLIEQRIGQPIPQVTIPVYDQGRSGVASFASLLVQAAEAGDPVAMEQLEQCVEGMLLHVSTALRLAGRNDLPVVVAGGLVLNSPLVMQMLREGLPGVQWLPLTQAPVYGAVLQAVGSRSEAFEKQYQMDEQKILKGVNNHGNEKTDS